MEQLATKRRNINIQHHCNSLYFLCDMLDNVENGLDQIQCQNLSDTLSQLAYSLTMKDIEA